MERSRSEDHKALGHVPPWERPNLAQVPHVGGSAPCLSDAEKSALPSLWATRSNTPRGPAVRTPTQRSDGSQFRSTPPPEDSSYRHNASMFKTVHMSPQPYETPASTPPAPRMQPSPPTYHSKELPATPPDSSSEASYTVATQSIPPRAEHVTHALPGTMSARNARARTPSRARLRSSGSGRRSKRPTKMDRWRSAVREFFTKDPVDGTQFERIEERHWADD